MTNSPCSSSGFCLSVMSSVCEDPAPEVPDTFSAPFRDLVSR